MNRRSRSLILPVVLPLLMFTLLTGCEDSPKLRTVQMPIGGKTFTLEVADDDATRETGLMKRDSMPADRGMIFVFPDETERGFWMKNTRIPLDILYVAQSGQIVSAKTMRPYDLQSVQSEGRAKYAIELNAGVVNRLGVKPGDILRIPDAARDTKQ